MIFFFFFVCVCIYFKRYMSAIFAEVAGISSQAALVTLWHTHFLFLFFLARWHTHDYFVISCALYGIHLS
jgi:hypothetical protein